MTIGTSSFQVKLLDKSLLYKKVIIIGFYVTYPFHFKSNFGCLFVKNSVLILVGVILLILKLPQSLVNSSLWTHNSTLRVLKQALYSEKGITIYSIHTVKKSFLFENRISVIECPDGLLFDQSSASVSYICHYFLDLVHYFEFRHHLTKWSEKSNSGKVEVEIIEGTLQTQHTQKMKVLTKHVIFRESISENKALLSQGQKTTKIYLTKQKLAKLSF